MGVSLSGTDRRVFKWDKWACLRVAQLGVSLSGTDGRVSEGFESVYK